MYCIITEEVSGNNNKATASQGQVCPGVFLFSLPLTKCMGVGPEEYKQQDVFGPGGQPPLCLPTTVWNPKQERRNIGDHEGTKAVQHNNSGERKSSEFNRGY